MSHRYLFLCPDRRSASGGIAVIYDTAAFLRRQGYDVVIVHNSANAGYPDHPDVPPLACSMALRQAILPYIGRRRRLAERINMLRERFTTGPIPRLSLRSNDVIITPEFMLADAMKAFPHHQIGVFVQNPFSFQKAHEMAQLRGYDIRERAQWFIGVSEVCYDQFDLLGINNFYRLPVSMKPEEFPFGHHKENLITYMPRKRPSEARLIVDALHRNGKIAGYKIEALDNMTRQQIATSLQRSRFFISLQKEESIGFPAAEAMAAGCVVVGYTGLGAQEYFTDVTGIPVTENDTAALVRAIETAVMEHTANPARLEAMRIRASAEIHRLYSLSNFETSLRVIWEQIDAHSNASTQ